MSSEEKKLVLRSSDGEDFEVEEAEAKHSQTINDMLEVCVGRVIPLQGVSSKTLAKVIQYLAHTERERKRERKMSICENESRIDWDAKFIREVDQSALFDLIQAANYLNIKSLLDLTCKAIADMMKGKTPEENSETFGFKKDLTPEQENEVRREYPWVFE